MPTCCFPQYGGNPSGVTASYARRVEVLRIARKYDILVLEDDPYYFLYYGDAPPPPSYFALEKQMGGEVGRVIRLDSFSKVLAAGFRLGWVTGPNALVTAIERHVGDCLCYPSEGESLIYIHRTLCLLFRHLL